MKGNIRRCILETKGSNPTATLKKARGIVKKNRAEKNPNQNKEHGSSQHGKRRDGASGPERR